MRRGSVEIPRPPLATAAARVVVATLMGSLAGVLFASVASASWPYQGRLLLSTSAGQYTPVAVADGNGGAIVVWSQDDSQTGRDIKVALVDGSGIVQWFATACRAPGDQTDPVIATDGAGGAVLAWVDQRNGNKDIYANRVAFSGGFHGGWHADDQNGKQITFSVKDEFAPEISSDGASGAYIAWNLQFGTGDRDVYLQHVTSGGSLASGFPSTGLGVAVPTGDQERISLATDATGYALLAWEDDRPTNPRRFIYAQRVSSTATPQWAVNGIQVSNGVNGDFYPVIAPAPGAGSVLAWSQLRLPSDGLPDIFAQRLNAGGVAVWPSNVPVTDYPGSDVEPVLAVDPVRGAWIAWHNFQHPPSIDEFLAVTLLQWDGTVAPGFGSGHQLVYGSFSIHDLAIAGAGDGGAVLTWSDERTGYFFRFLQQVSPEGLDAFENSGWPICAIPTGQASGNVVSDGGIGAIAVWEDGRILTRAVYAYRVAGPGNLVASYVPTGWSSPIVPRNAGDANLGNTVLSSSLPGGVQGTWLNWNIEQTDEKQVVMDTGRLTLDEEYTLDQLIWTNPEFGPFFTFRNNAGPFTIEGGRHSLRATADANGTVFEREESDNDWIGQWVWSPPALAYQVPQGRPKPPDRGLLALPNSDGFSFTRGVFFAWAVGIMPVGADDDYDLGIYSNYSSSTSGFSTMIGGSAQGGNATDFVGGHFSGTPTQLYPAIFRFDASDGDLCWIDPTDARNRNVDDTTEDSQTFFESFGTGRLLNVYEFMLFSGQTYYFGLLRQSGVGDLRFEVFPGTAGSTWFRGAGVPSNAVIPEYDNLTFVAPATGWYPVVVFRDAGDGGAALLDYRFQWSTAPIVGVDPAPEASAHVLSFDPIVPNPGRGSIQFGFTLPAPGPARLELYDAAGRRVRLLRDGDHPAGRTTLRWDGRDDSGAPTAAGLYWVRFEAAGRTLARKLVRIP